MPDEKKISEQVDISINESEKEIKVLDVELTIPESGKLKFVSTEALNGELSVAIIEAKQVADIKIYMEGLEDCPIFDVISYYGKNYLPLRTPAMNKDMEMFNYAPQKWYMNDRIAIEISGVAGEIIKIQLRYD